MSWQDTIQPITPAGKASWEESIKPIGKSTEPSMGDDLSKELQTYQDLASSTGRNLLGGAGAKAEAAIRAGAEDLTGNPEKKSLAELYDQYKHYVATKEQEAQKRSPLAAGAGKFAGNILPWLALRGQTPGMQALMGAGIGGITKAQDPNATAKNIAVSAGTGAITPTLFQSGVPAAAKIVGGGVLGATEANNHPGEVPTGDIAKGAVLGAAVPAIFEGASAAKNYAMSALKNSTAAKQLAATAINATPGPNGEAGGTVFGQEGERQTIGSSNKLATDTSNQIEKLTTDANANYDKAYEDASAQGKVLNSDQSTATQKAVSDFQYDLGREKINLDPMTERYLRMYQAGNLPPQNANDLRKAISAIPTTTANMSTLAQTKQNILGALTDDLNSTIDGTTQQALDTTRRSASEYQEPFIQRAGKIVGEDQGQMRMSNSLDPDVRRLRVKETLSNIIDKSGAANDRGAVARQQLQEITPELEKTNETGNLGQNPAELTQGLQNQGYLRAAQKTVSGIDTQTKLGKLGDILFKNPAFKVTEYAATAPLGIGKKVQSVAAQLLQGTPEELSAIGAKLKQIPVVSHMGQGLQDAVKSGDRTKLNAAMFLIMQNPTARQTIEQHSDGNI